MCMFACLLLCEADNVVSFQESGSASKTGDNIDPNLPLDYIYTLHINSFTLTNQSLTQTFFLFLSNLTLNSPKRTIEGKICFSQCLLLFCSLTSHTAL